MMDEEVYIHPTALVDTGARIGPGSKVWHFCHLMPGAVLGAGCSLGQNVFVANGVRLGDGCRVQNNVSLYEGVICEADVFIGPSAVFTNVINPRAGINRKDSYRTTYLEQGVTIGANATIVCGIRIGRYAFIGAGTVVLRDVAPYALVVGNPARQIGWMSARGERLQFDTHGEARCPATGERYRLQDGHCQSADGD